MDSPEEKGPSRTFEHKHNDRLGSDKEETKMNDAMSNTSETADCSGCARRCGTIAINLCGSSHLLWRTAEVKLAREAGIVGSLVGSLARQPRQNSRLGRPLELLKEEARFLGETQRSVFVLPAGNGSAELASDQQAYEVVQHRERLEQSYQEQSTLALQDRKAALLRVAEKQRAGESRKGSDQAVQSRLDALESSFSFPRLAMAVQLSTAKAGLGHDPEERCFLAADLTNIRDERSEARFRVFRDLRRQGFYLTSAGKFGGDYLVYPGEPLRFHAHFIAVCVPMDEPVPLFDLLALSRLGVNVKKTILLCSPAGGAAGGQEEEVVYTSLKWSGMV